MATPAFEPKLPHPGRAAINRENARHSTGPRTASGKDRVRLNALKHGALSRTVVFPYENQAAFDALGAKLAAACQPATDEEGDGLLAIQNTHWRLDRVLSLEGNLYAVGIKEELQPARNFFSQLDETGHVDIARARAYHEKARTFDQLHRQEMRLRRLLDKQVADYLEEAPQPAETEAQPIVAKPQPIEAKPQPIEAKPQPEPMKTAAAGDGFVSHADSAASEKPTAMPRFTGPLKDIKRKQWLKQHRTSQAAASTPAPPASVNDAPVSLATAPLTPE